MISKLKIKHDDLALLLVRIGLGLVFMVHGYIKLSETAGMIGFFSSLHLGAVWVYLVGWTELLAGLAVLLGIFSRFGSILLTTVMTVVILRVKLHSGFSNSELEILLLLCSVAIALAGPGQYTVKSILNTKI